MEDEMKVTVIATGFKYQPVETPAIRPTMQPSFASQPLVSPPTPARPAGMMASAERAAERHDDPGDVPFYRKAVAQSRPDDPGGFGPNWSAVDDYDIPTILRKQMD